MNLVYNYYLTAKCVTWNGTCFEAKEGASEFKWTTL